MQKERNSRRVCKILIIIGAIFILLLSFVLHNNIRLLRDDFLYYSFTKHGFWGFVIRILGHYFLINGRLLVHFFDSLFVGSDGILFTIFNNILIIASVWLLIQITVENKERRFAAFCISYPVFFLIGNYVLSESVLWISGSFNYVFSLALLLAYIFFLLKVRNGVWHTVIYVFAFLSSITTEMIGVLGIIFTFIFLFNGFKNNSDNKKIYLRCGIIQICGVLFLILSPGMHSRMVEDNSITQFVMRTLINFNTFIQMTWEKGGIGYVISFCMLLCSVNSFAIHKRLLSVLMFLAGIVPFLTLSGIVYCGQAYLIMSVISLLLLFWYGVETYEGYNRINLIFVVFFVISFGIISASGIVGYRMLFVPSMCLLGLGIRAQSNINWRYYGQYLICFGLVTLCCLNMVDLIDEYEKNSHIWDENKKIIEANEGEPIVLKNVNDEMIFQGACPVRNNFGDQYLLTFGIPEDVEVSATEKRYYIITDEKGVLISDKGIKRNEKYYVKCELLFDYLGANYNWNYDTINATYNDKLYRLHYGAMTIMNDYFGGQSVKLQNPIRIVDSWMYISVEDARRIFDLELNTN